MRARSRRLLPLREGIAVPGVPHLSAPVENLHPLEPKLCDAFTYCAVFGEAPWLLVASAAQAASSCRAESLGRVRPAARLAPAQRPLRCACRRGGTGGAVGSTGGGTLRWTTLCGFDRSRVP